MASEDELEIDELEIDEHPIEEEESNELGDEELDEEGKPKPKPVDQKKIDEQVRSELAELRGRVDGQSSIAESIKALISKSQQDNVRETGLSKEEKEARKRKFQEDILSDDAEGAVERLVEERMEARIAKLIQQGQGIFETGGQTHVDKFLMRKEKELRETPKIYERASEEFESKITAQHRSALASATKDQRDAFFSDIWDQALGKMYARSIEKKVSAKRLGGSESGSSGSSASKGFKFPGASESERRGYERMAREYSTDPETGKVDTKKMREYLALAQKQLEDQRR